MGSGSEDPQEGFKKVSETDSSSSKLSCRDWRLIPNYMRKLRDKIDHQSRVVSQSLDKVGPPFLNFQFVFRQQLSYEATKRLDNCVVRRLPPVLIKFSFRKQKAPAYQRLP
ncbi:hypothetical protein RsS62_64370 [Rhizobium dioscoreae]|nr:hypothetical protein RsS62_64370 [Rhizobium dioscoreae]